MKELPDCDNFVVGTQEDFEPLGYDLPALMNYLKKNKKTFEYLTDSELKQFLTS